MMTDVKFNMDLLNLIPFDNASDLNKYLMTAGSGLANYKMPLVGVIFDRSFSSNTMLLPSQLDFSLRFPSELRSGYQDVSTASQLYNNWMTNHLYPPFGEGGPRNKNSSTGGRPPGYYDERFSSIQSAISLAFIKAHNNLNIPIVRMVLNRFPYPPGTIDLIIHALKIFTYLVFFLSFLYPCINNVKVSKLVELKYILSP